MIKSFCKNFFKYSKDRKWYINLLFAFVSLIGVVIIPSAFYLMFQAFIHNDTVCDMLANFMFIALLIFMYYKDLVLEFKNIKKNFKESTKIAFKYYAIGLMLMIFFNLIIVLILKNISSNENQVRDMLYGSPITTMISIMIIAPISEELIFRKSIRPLLNNKLLYALVSGLLFGGAHLLTNILSGTFVLTDLVYLLPYGSLGVVFALMDYETDSTFTSMGIHAIHNTFTGVILLITYFSGVI